MPGTGPASEKSSKIEEIIVYIPSKIAVFKTFSTSAVQYSQKLKRVFRLDFVILHS